MFIGPSILVMVKMSKDVAPHHAEDIAFKNELIIILTLQIAILRIIFAHLTNRVSRSL